MRSIFKAASEPNIIELLTQLRHANYPMSSINSLNENHLSQIQELVTELGQKILGAKSDADPKVGEARANVQKVVSELIKTKNKYAIVSFATQLLQYYTIICDQDFEPKQSLEDFNQLLVKKRAFGDVSKNLFVTEYRLVKIYNDLITLTDAQMGKIAPIRDGECKLGILLEQLAAIKEKIDEWEPQNPDNIFLSYLNFTVNYTYAQVLECQFNLQKHKLSEQEKALYADSQKDIFLKAALDALVKIRTLVEYCNERQTPFAKGAEFSLGQSLLHKMPVDDLKVIQEHVSSLVSAP
ncbi:hypothetical protein [Legionella drancourtii]|uniref:Uncharacterized protein n=1 Tax=Legionella drancourtii LLAP12 TaxID=658187 RepID=G9ETI8_9GAMM|nr:hypothetical protein [Legionella drancourtii]EHL29655.1 hypothetical protein LDG_8620 [Legionella drancourtii LLAP12]